ncbi:hypothetical protein AGMMS50293_01530 [Spirochaetia bacterium]|nr:hypothetical protein AGMMS50293_01530 [Spirochaetia bacterium]
MQKEIITLFTKYNKSVNEAMNDIIKTLSPEEWEKPLDGFFPSVRSQCSHLYICDFNWLKRFRNFRPFSSLNDSSFDQNYSFKDTLFADMDEYLDKRPELDGRMMSFSAEITDADLAGTLKYTDSHGKVYERNFGGCVMQSLNHGAHHRGGISVYLDMLGKENDFSSLGQVL